jgi:phenylpyruvate tautomerase PptA (4-oxalocrotonate tautomerase family)
MRKKKDLPLVILKSLHPFVNLRGEKFETIEPKENLLKVIDQDSESEFHFIIEEFKKTNNGGFQFLMSRSPSNENENGIKRTWVDIAQLKPQFEIWLKLLDEYENIDSFFDDPIINSFKDEFYTEFEIIDEEADIKPLNTKQILSLDSYLEKVNNKLNKHITDENSDDIKEIQEQIETLKGNLTSESKKWVVKKLTTIWAKIAKQGTEYIKEFLTESKKEMIKQGVKGLIEYVKESGTELLN